MSFQTAAVLASTFRYGLLPPKVKTSSCILFKTHIVQNSFLEAYATGKAGSYESHKPFPEDS